MISFLKHIVIVIAILFISAVGLDRIYSSLLTRPSTDSPLKKAFSYSNQEWDLVFFGSSRVVNNIDCSIISKLTGKSCLNMGSMGSTLKNDAFLFEVLLSNNNAIRDAFFQVDYKYNDFSLGSHFKADLIPFTGRELVDQYLKDEQGNALLWDIPFYRYMINDKVIGIRKVLVPIAGLFGKDAESGYKPLDGEGVLINVSLPDNYERNINSDLYEKARGAINVNLNYFTAPFCEEIKNREAMRSLNNLFDSYINYATLYDSNQEYFNDCLHLNRLGSKNFSEKIAEDIIRRRWSSLTLKSE
jgi:hypothetical protein